jgi:hypothetical protein
VVLAEEDSDSVFFDLVDEAMFKVRMVLELGSWTAFL